MNKQVKLILVRKSFVLIKISIYQWYIIKEEKETQSYEKENI